MGGVDNATQRGTNEKKMVQSSLVMKKRIPLYPSYNSSPNATPTNGTVMPAARLIWIITAPFAFDLLVDEDDDAVVDDDGDNDDDAVVPFCCFAAASNAAKLLGPDSTALTLKTIPEPQ